METTEIIYIVAGAFLVSLPLLKVLAKRTETVLDDKILTLLAIWAKKIVGK
jgi:hypothetical protein